MNKLTEIVTVEIPEVMINEEEESMLREYDQRLMQQGLNLDQFLKFTNQSKDALKEQFKEDAIKRIKINLGLSEIAKIENIEVSDDDIKAEYDKMADMYKMDVEDIKKYIPEESLKDDLKINKTLESLKK
jgi:trigger factor